MTTLKTGDLAPAFTLSGLQGASRRVPDALAPLSIVVFVKEECETSQMTMPFLGRLVGAYGDEIPFFIVAENEEAEARGMARLGGLPGESVYLEPAPYEASAAYQLFSVPTLLVISAGQVIEEVIVGWNRAQYERLSERLRVATQRPGIELITASDGKVPSMRPG